MVHERMFFTTSEWTGRRVSSRCSKGLSTRRLVPSYCVCLLLSCSFIALPDILLSHPLPPHPHALNTPPHLTLQERRETGFVALAHTHTSCSKGTNTTVRVKDVLDPRVCLCVRRGISE